MNPRRLSDGFAAAILAAAALVGPRAALADPATPDLADDEDEDGPEAGTRRASPPDTRFGHVLVDLKAGLTAPAGRLDGDTVTADVAGSGQTFGGALGLGVSRHVVLEANGAFSRLAGGCDACKAQGFDLGLGLRYHLTQGIAVDPWASFGFGFRSATFTVLAPAAQQPENTNESQKTVDRRYQGLDYARIALGTNFYPFSFLGFGPYVEADLGANVSRPDPSLRLTTYAFLHLGVRIAIDPLRSGSHRPRATAGRR